MARGPGKLERAGALICMALVVCLIAALLASGCGGQEQGTPQTPQDEPGEPGESPENGENGEEGNGDPEPAAGIRGNHPGNYDAVVLERDGWIYYTSFGYENVKKVNVDGSGAAVLSTDTNASAFNMLDGWLYYVCDAGLVKLRSDGNGREVLLARPDPYYFHYLNLVDGWIYYAVKHHDLSGNGIFKLPLAGGAPQQLSDDQVYLGMCVADGWIYFDSSEIEYGVVYRMRTDGSDREFLDYGVRPVMIDCWLYYTNFSQILRMDPENGAWTAISVDLYTYNFNVAGDWVYYVHKLDDLKLHRTAWGSGGTEAVVEDQVGAVYLYGDAVYYKSHTDWRTYRVTPGTTTGVVLP